MKTPLENEKHNVQTRIHKYVEANFNGGCKAVLSGFSVHGTVPCNGRKVVKEI
jgi:hypothetical protein